MGDLRALIHFYVIGFWERRWSIILVAWSVCVAGWLFVATLPNQYEADARIYVDTETILGPLMKGLAITSDVQTQVEMMRRTLLSRPNLEQLIRLTDLDLTVQSPLGRERLIENLGSDIVLATEGKDLFQIRYQSADPQRAYRVVDGILEIFVEQNLGRTQRDVEDARTFIDKQIVEYDTKLREAELNVAQFQQQHGEELAGSRSAQQRLDQAQARVRQMRVELESVIWRRDQLAQQLAATPRTLPASQVSTIQLSPDEQRLADMRRQLDELLLVYTDRHPSVIGLKSRIDQLARTLPAGSRGPGGSTAVTNPLHQQIELELKSTEAMITDLRRRIEFAEQEAQLLASTATLAPQVEADLKRVTRDYDVLSEQYTQLIQRREAARMAQRLDTETKSVEFRIVDPPAVPLSPIGPPHGLFMLGVVVLGFGAGFGIALLRILLTSSLVSADQLQDVFGLPVLGSISIVRSALHTHVRIAEGIALGGTVVGLVAATSFVFYVYQLSGHKPDIASVAAGLRDRLQVSLPAI
jgi:polysaccharide chain length determinant protein (PEP-CTERM system associated)